ncbi:MAG TPA: phosphatase PAP2 family protein [Kineosporiaceae bacterium]|nr:phosphatase PAP2 family protein [Kineosporiaceae bacterium]
MDRHARPRPFHRLGLDHVFLDINTFARHAGWLHGPVKVYANDGIALFAVLLLVNWWTARNRATTAAMVAAVWAPIGMLAAVAINQPIVAAVDETRPYASLSNILVLAQRTTDPSFPSDHATMAGAVTAGLLIANRRLGLISAAAAALMALSRVYIGAHYPQDVLAGLALGALIGAGGYYLTRRPLTALIRYLAGTRLRPLLTAVSAPETTVAS